MKVNYRKGYAEGGFLDDGASVDPISGNEVPTGSLQEEVRDDVPAQLSEGEFVVPADVVRFIGLEKLMRMRDKAKSGLAHMEEAGQIGGSPVMEDNMPMEMSEMMGEGDDPEMDALIDGMDGEGFEASASAFATGGFVQTENGSWLPKGADVEPVSVSYEDMMGRGFGTVPTTETLVYINADGHKVYIPVVDGEPAYTPPEGYTLVLDDTVAEEEVVEEVIVEEPVSDTGPTGISKAQRKAEIVASDRAGRDRYKSIQSQATSDMSQEGIDNVWGQMTQQEKSVYETRMKDPKWIDKFMTEDMAPVDRMLLAIQTVNATNTRNGLSLNRSTDSTFSDESIDLASLAKVIGGALSVGIPGILTVAAVKKFGADSAEVKSAATEYLQKAKELALSGLGRGSGRTGDEGTQPPAAAPTEYNQQYWKENFYDKGLGTDSTAIAAEQLRIASETGKNAYGQELTQEQKDNVNSLARSKYLVDKNARTIAKREAAAEAAADELALTNQENARNNSYTSSVTSGKDMTTDANQQNSGRFDDKPSVTKPAVTKPYSQADTLAAKKAAEDRATDKHWGLAAGGLASKKKPAVKKMRKDNTAGLASKKKAKQKAKAKKGALAAKRT